MREKVVEHFGGCTECLGTGYWKHYVERVQIINLYVFSLDHRDHERIREWLRGYMVGAGEECVFYVIDGAPNFINS